MRVLLVSQMAPGPDDPDYGAFVVQLADALERRGHSLERAVLEGRGGGRRKWAELGRRTVTAARRSRPDVVWAHFLIPTGVIALAGR
ncbi:MAG: hypothetical protein M3229_03555, partial [Actinomycetota bacterium]|nr:hypothetical protein [Actinomycetota bacterium]